MVLRDILACWTRQILRDNHLEIENIIRISEKVIYQFRPCEIRVKTYSSTPLIHIYIMFSNLWKILKISIKYSINEKIEKLKNHKN